MSLARRAFTLGALSAAAAASGGLSLPRAALAASRDGLNWTPLNQNNPVAVPTAGQLGLRDPFVLRKQDGTFVVLATDLKGTNFGLNSQYLHVWDSTDLTSLTGYRRIQVHTLGAHGVLGRRPRPVRHRLLRQQRPGRLPGQLHQ